MANLPMACQCLLRLAEVAASQNALDYSARLLGALVGLEAEAGCFWEDTNGRILPEFLKLSAGSLMRTVSSSPGKRGRL